MNSVLMQVRERNSNYWGGANESEPSNMGNEATKKGNCHNTDENP